LIRAAAFDIDGTLTDMERRLDPLSVEAVARLEVPVILATGNVHCFTRTTSVLLGISGVSLSENGGIISYGDGQMEVLADISLCEKAYRKLGEVFDLDRMDSRYRMTDIVLDRNFDVGRAVSILEEEKLAVDLVDSKFAVHIKDRKVDKGTALLKIMDHLRLRPDEVAVVGDSVSDLPMFLVTGFGAAVANGSSQLKEAADYVAKEEFGKGAYEIVEYMIEKEMF